MLKTVKRRFASGPQPGVRPPNILFLMTDQQRWDALGRTGGWVATPHIDRIAANGVLFPNAYTNAPHCIPARVSLALGLYPHNHGVRSNRTYTMRRRAPNWMRSIREAGYRTSVFGKTHLHPHKGDLRENAEIVHAWGFDHVEEIAGPRASLVCDFALKDRWVEAGVYEAYRRDLQDRFRNKPWLVRPSPLPLELYPDVYVGRQAAAHLRGLDESTPWFCWVSFSGPHEPYDPPEPYAGRYDPEEMPAPIPYWDDDHARPQGWLDVKRSRIDFEPGPGEIATLRAGYAAKVTLIDDQVGELLSVIEERGEWDQTVVAFVSDHGEMNGDYDLIRKGNFLNPAVRVPFIVRAPGSAEGATSDAVVELMDIGATLVELALGSQPKRSLARSLVPVLEEPTKPHRSGALSELYKETMLATHDWKIGVNRDWEPYLLFDLKGDPSETRNLAGLSEYRDTEQELVRELDRLLKATS
jgi:arylsulfatase